MICWSAIDLSLCYTIKCSDSRKTRKSWCTFNKTSIDFLTLGRQGNCLYDTLQLLWSITVEKVPGCVFISYCHISLEFTRAFFLTFCLCFPWERTKKGKVPLELFSAVFFHQKCFSYGVIVIHSATQMMDYNATSVKSLCIPCSLHILPGIPCPRYILSEIWNE